jgi:hypothetical protein
VQRDNSTLTLQFAIARSEWNCVPPASHSLQKEPWLRHTWMRSETRTQARSESHSEVHGKCNSVRRRRTYRPIETDWQVCFDEVALNKLLLCLMGQLLLTRGVNPTVGLSTTNAARNPTA